MNLWGILIEKENISNPLIKEGMNKTKMPLFKRWSESFKNKESNILLNCKTTTFISREEYIKVKSALIIIHNSLPTELSLILNISITGSLEENAAVKGTPHNLRLATRVDVLIKGEEYTILPVFFID